MSNRFETLQAHAGREQRDPTRKSGTVPTRPTTAHTVDDADRAAGLFALQESGDVAVAIRARVEELRDLGPALSPRSAWLHPQGPEHVEDLRGDCAWALEATQR